MPLKHASEASATVVAVARCGGVSRRSSSREKHAHIRCAINQVVSKFRGMVKAFSESRVEDVLKPNKVVRCRSNRALEPRKRVGYRKDRTCKGGEREGRFTIDVGALPMQRAKSSMISPEPSTAVSSHAGSVPHAMGNDA